MSKKELIRIPGWLVVVVVIILCTIGYTMWQDAKIENCRRGTWHNQAQCPPPGWR